MNLFTDLRFDFPDAPFALRAVILSPLNVILSLSKGGLFNSLHTLLLFAFILSVLYAALRQAQDDS